MKEASEPWRVTVSRAAEPSLPAKSAREVADRDALGRDAKAKARVLAAVAAAELEEPRLERELPALDQPPALAEARRRPERLGRGSRAVLSAKDASAHGSDRRSTAIVPVDLGARAHRQPGLHRAVGDPAATSRARRRARVQARP